MQQVPADSDWKRRQRSENLDLRGDDADLFVCLAHGGCGDRFVRMIETPAGQRHLSAVIAQACDADRQWNPPLLLVWVNQQERGRGPEDRIRTWPPPRLRRESHLRIAAW